MFEKETSPAIERVPISPPHLLRIVALSRQPDLHGECTYGRLSRTSYEKRGLAASQAFPPKKKERERERERKIKKAGGLMDDVRSTRDISASLCPSVDK